jgi:hypothetical protein
LRANVKTKTLFSSLIIMLLVGCSTQKNSSSLMPTQEVTPFKLPPTWTPTITFTPRPSATLMDVATFTPVPAIPTLSKPILVPSKALTSRIYDVSIPGVFVNHLAMDDKYLYWTTEDGSDLFRYLLVSSTSTPAAIVAKTHFDKGTLSKYPNDTLSRVGAWLIFDDRQITGPTETWELSALNVETQTELNLAQDSGSTNLYTFSSDGEWVVWIAKDLSAGTTVIESKNLQTGQSQELARSDSRNNGWEQVAVSGGQAAAIQSRDDGRTLFLFVLKSGQSRKLLSDTTGSDMYGLTFDGKWIAWKTGTNSSGSTALYNLENNKIEILPDWGVSPLLVGHWLTWNAAYEQPLYVVDLESRQSFLVSEAQPGDNLTSVAIYGNLIGWCRVHSNIDHTKVDSRVEWRALP